MLTEQLAHPADGIVSSQPLGALYTPDQTTFRVWAPTASRVTLNLYESPVGGPARPMRMWKHRDGTWDTVLLGDWRGHYYTYQAAGHDPRFDPRREVIDPYARAVTAHDGRGIIVGDETPVAAGPSFPLADAVIYELHIRDFTIDPDSGIQRRGKYLGLTEANTHLTGRTDIATGLDHLAELGVNVVQLLPICEFHNDEAHDRYGWGYDVVHFNSPDGWYATERLDARRVSEAKRMIDALHRRGMRVTLDVVFNHTFESITKHRVYSFEGLVPGYYYRLRHDGNYWDGSGTGNEFRTEAPMARRFILDALKSWMTEYRVDGFRFDLLGLMDRDTMLEIVRELRAIDPNVLLYGEPWAGGQTPIPINGKGAQRSAGWAVFNDHFRDALKGNVFDARATGFSQSGVHLDAIKKGVRGGIDEFADAPVESINYVECHDNHTLWDRLNISTADNASITDVDRRAMDKLAAAVLLTAQGVPFLHAGQEFLRTKGGDHNSYDKPDPVNMIRWRMKAEHHDVFDYYRGLIALRRAHPLFRLQTAAEVRRGLGFLDELFGAAADAVPAGCLAYLIFDVTGRDDWARALVLGNPQSRPLPFRIPTGQWRLYANGREARPLPIAAEIETGAAPVTVPPRCAMIFGETRL